MKEILDMEALMDFLEGRGICVRLNVITRQVEISGVSQNFNQETLTADLPIILHNDLKLEFRCTKELIADLLGVIAGLNRYNPVLNLFKMCHWDGADHLSELYDILGLPEDDTLSRTLVSKWLAQCVAMAGNELSTAFGADGMLVLQGPQGIGKTSLVRKLSCHPSLCKLGQYIDTRDKDTIRRCISAWIVELGEIETTLRSDMERLKAFITAERDEYRLPYARADQTHARRTSLIATCNTPRFLVDPSGSRRFWTVPVTAIDLKALDRLDVWALWGQVKERVEAEPQCFRLTPTERRELAKRNVRYERAIPAQLEVEDLLTKAEEHRDLFMWTYVTVTEFKEQNPVLRRYSAEQVGKALDRMGVVRERKYTQDGRQHRMRLLPVRRPDICTASTEAPL